MLSRRKSDLDSIIRFVIISYQFVLSSKKSFSRSTMGKECALQLLSFKIMDYVTQILVERNKII